MTRVRLPYQPALDGLRGVAVAGVVAFHLGYLPGGFLGVDLFFTLSGYLITRLLLIEHENTGRINLGAFWSRRLWRLLPALLLVLVAVSIYAATAARPDELDGIRESGLAALFYVANWQFIATGDGYWNLFTTPTPFDHLWSLAIEEQFYVVWPLIFAAVLRFRAEANREPRLRRLLGVTLGLTVASGLLLALDEPTRAYLSTLSRSSSILLGAALAIVVQRGDSWLPRLARGNRGLATAGLATAYLTWSWITIDGSNEVAFYNGGFFAHALAVCVLIAFSTHQVSHPLLRPLTSWPLRRLGTVSYGLYLWHWPILVFFNEDRMGYGGGPLLLTRLGVTLAVTIASYTIVERPARLHGASWVPTRVGVPVAMAAIAVVVLVATVAPTHETIVAATPTTQVPPTVPTTTVPTTTVSEAAAETTTTTTPPPALVVTYPATPPGLRTPTVDDPLRVLLIGDSYLYDAQLGIEAALLATDIVTVDLEGHVGFSLNQKTAVAHLKAKIADTDPDLVVAMWALFDVAAIEEQGNDTAAHVAYGELLDEALAILTNEGAVVAVSGLPPSLSRGIDRVPIDLTINDLFTEAAERAGESVFYLNPDPIVAPTGKPERWIETEGGEILVRKADVSHYCSDGAARFGLAIGELLAAMTGSVAADPADWWAGEWRTDERYHTSSGSCGA